MRFASSRLGPGLFLPSLIVVSIALLGCATTAKFEEHLKNRMGQDISDVIAQIGPPTSSLKLPNGNTAYTWASAGAYHSQLQQAGFGDPQVVTYNDSCKVTYTADQNNKLIAWHHDGGNMCRSR
jgi:hypothetical protein